MSTTNTNTVGAGKQHDPNKHNLDVLHLGACTNCGGNRFVDAGSPLDTQQQNINQSSVEGEYVLRIIDTDKWYWCKCENCGWEDSSEYCDGGGQIADTGDYFDPACPVCGSIDLEGQPACKVEEYDGVRQVKIPLDVYMKPYKWAVQKMYDPRTPSSPVESPSCSGESLVTEAINSDGASVVSLTASFRITLGNLRNKYSTYAANIDWHIENNAPAEVERIVLRKRATDFKEMVADLDRALMELDSLPPQGGNGVPLTDIIIKELPSTESPDNTPTPVSSEGGK